MPMPYCQQLASSESKLSVELEEFDRRTEAFWEVEGCSPQRLLSQCARQLQLTSVNGMVIPRPSKEHVWILWWPDERSHERAHTSQLRGRSDKLSTSHEVWHATEMTSSIVGGCASNAELQPQPLWTEATLFQKMALFANRAKLADVSRSGPEAPEWALQCHSK